MFNRIVDSRQTNKSSMAFDVVKHRKTEIDFISGAVSKLEKNMGLKHFKMTSCIILLKD